MLGLKPINCIINKPIPASVRFVYNDIGSHLHDLHVRVL